MLKVGLGALWLDLELALHTLDINFGIGRNDGERLGSVWLLRNFLADHGCNSEALWIRLGIRRFLNTEFFFTVSWCTLCWENVIMLIRVFSFEIIKLLCRKEILNRVFPLFPLTLELISVWLFDESLQLVESRFLILFTTILFRLIFRSWIKSKVLILLLFLQFFLLLEFHGFLSNFFMLLL